jgi:hypothetical protein
LGEKGFVGIIVVVVVVIVVVAVTVVVDFVCRPHFSQPVKFGFFFNHLSQLKKRNLVS